MVVDGAQGDEPGSLSRHAPTNADVIRQFTAAAISHEAAADRTVSVVVEVPTARARG